MKSKRLKSVVKPLLCAAISLSLPSFPRPSLLSPSLPTPSSVYPFEWFNAVPSIRTYDHLSPLPFRPPHLSFLHLSFHFFPFCLLHALPFFLTLSYDSSCARSFLHTNFFPLTSSFVFPSFILHSVLPSFFSFFILFSFLAAFLASFFPFLLASSFCHSFFPYCFFDLSFFPVPLLRSSLSSILFFPIHSLLVFPFPLPIIISSFLSSSFTYFFHSLPCSLLRLLTLAKAVLL